MFPLNPLRWYGTLEYYDFHEKFNFLTIQDLRPLNTCQKHFEMILPNFPLDECEVHSGISFVYIATAIATAVYPRNVN